MSDPIPKSAVSQADPVKTTAHRHIIGLDLGQLRDPSALCILEDSESWLEKSEGWAESWADFYAVRHLHRWPLKTKYPQIVSDVAELLRSPQLRSPLLVIDATGVGRAVCDLFADAELGIPIRRVVITGGHRVHHDDNGDWLVPKKELVSVLQALLQGQRLTIAKLPERELLVQELLSFKVKITAALNETFEAWRERDHDDMVLAVALACWAAESTASSSRGEMPFSLGRKPGPFQDW